MKNISFSIFQDNKLQQLSLQDLLNANERVLICSTPHCFSSVIIEYQSYLSKVGELYKKLYDIKMYTTRVHVLSLAHTINTENFTILNDSNKDFIKYLANIYNKTDDIRSLDGVRLLSWRWFYQALFVNGKLEQFYDQPTDNYVKHATKFIYKDKILVNTIQNSKDVYFSKDSDLRFRKHKYSRIEHTPEYGQKLLLHNLWHNTKLEQYLLDKYTKNTL